MIRKVRKVRRVRKVMDFGFWILNFEF